MKNPLEGWGKRPDESWSQYLRAVILTLRVMLFHRELYRHLSRPMDPHDFVEVEPFNRCPQFCLCCLPGYRPHDPASCECTADCFCLTE